MNEHVRSPREREPALRVAEPPRRPIAVPQLSVHGVLALQRAAGNQATARVLARANLRWSPEPKPVIVKIDFGKRSGKQDDHTTAYTAFEETVLQNLRGKPLKAAVIELLLLVNEITELEGFKNASHGLPGKVQELRLRLLALLETADAAPIHVSGELGAAIDDYLRLRNLVPGTKEKKSAAIRDPNAPSPGQLEKRGKQDLRAAIDALRDEKGTYADVEAHLKSALGKLHDYVTTRKEMPSKREFADVVSQHFQSIMQVSPVLQRIAEQLLATWLGMVTAAWGELLGLDEQFAARVRDACSLYVQASKGKKRKGVFDDDGKSDLKFVEDMNIDADDGYRLDPDDADEMPKDVFGRVRVVDTRELSRAQVISYLNRMAEQGLIRAAQLIQHIIDQDQETQDEIIDDLDLRFAILPDGRVFFKLRGG